MAILTELLGIVRGRNEGFPGGNPAKRPAASVFDEPWLPTSRTKAGVTVDETSAMTVSAVYRAVQLVASTIGSLPLHVYETQPDDGARERVTYAEDEYLWGRPNPEVTRSAFWETVIGHEVMSGNAFLWVGLNTDGDPLELWPVAPQRVRVGRDDEGRKVYTVDGEVPFRDYRDGGEIIHVMGFSLNGLLGISPVRQMALTIGLAKAAEDFAATLFAQGTTLGGILHTDQQLEPAQAQEFARRWDAAHSGLRNAQRTAVMTHGLRWEPTMINPEDAQMLATRQFQVAEIARMFGVPEHLIGSHDKQSSWGQGLEVNNRAFVQFTLGPHIIRFEQAITDALLPSSRYVKFAVEGLLRGTAMEQANYLDRLLRMGVLSPNQIAALLDFPGIGVAGDLHLAPLNMARLEQLASQPTTVQAPEETPEEQPTE